MSESSPFRTENNHHYRWPPEPFDGPFEKYERVTHVIGGGEPKEWMRNYVASQLASVLTERTGEIMAYLVNSHNEVPEQFSLDQEWWNGLLDQAYQNDLNQVQKREFWDAGDLPHLKTRPALPYQVKTLLKLTPPLKFMKWFKAAPDLYRDSTAVRGTTVHKIVEEIVQNRPVDFDPALTGWIQHAEKFLSRYNPRFIEIESVVYSDKFGYAGQFDWLAEISVDVMKTIHVYNPKTKKYEPWQDNRSDRRKKESPDFIRVWGDYKTGEKGIKENIALQLSAYYGADFIGRVDGTKDPIPHVDEFWGVSIREDAYEVVPVRVDAETFEAFLDVRAVGKWMTQTRKTVLNKPLQEIAE